MGKDIEKAIKEAHEKEPKRLLVFPKKKEGRALIKKYGLDSIETGGKLYAAIHYRYVTDELSPFVCA